ncbi:MAG: NYN domain-containing protein [Thermoplasmata archaeon]
MKKKTAILVDWENIRKTVFEKCSPTLDYNRPETIKHFISFFIDNSEEEIFRIFLYLSEPASKFYYQKQSYDFSNYPAFKKHDAFVRKMSVQNYFAIRKGKLKFRGYKNDGKPDFVQKGVDMLIGLDIAHLSYKKIVERILILSGDTDIKPAMKTARINGVQVVIGNCSDITPIAKELKTHADIIRDRNFYDICYEWFKINLIRSIPQWIQDGKIVKTGLVISSWINNWGLMKINNVSVNDFFKRMIKESLIEIKPENPDNELDGKIILKQRGVSLALEFGK